MASAGPRRTGVWLLAGFALAASLAFFVYRLATPSDGAVAAFYANAWQVDGVAVQPIDQLAGGLRAGDVVRTVAGRSISDWLDHAADPTIDRSALTAPGPVAYAITREG